jgi:site-specific DNA-adenine methylase
MGIFRYPGGKGRKAVYTWILGHAPDVVAEYREPFVGGGGVFFRLSGIECWKSLP